SANLAILANYGVTAAKLTLLTGAINAYHLLLNMSRAARVAGKPVADNIETEFAAADKDLAVMDKLVGQFSANRKFGLDYNNARKIAAADARPSQPAPKIKPQATVYPQARTKFAPRKSVRPGLPQQYYRGRVTFFHSTQP